jgi:predicted nucleotidyltransferase
MNKNSLADALFTSTQQRVLAPLFGQPDKSFYVTQLMEMARSGRGAVQRELKRLSESGLVTVRNIATQKHYQANPASPLFEELCRIVQKTSGLHDPIRKALEPLQDKIELAFIYGSVANRTDHSASDIDLMVVSDEVQLEELYSSLAAVEQQLARQISPTLLTREEFSKRCAKGGSFVERVMNGRTIPLIGNASAE